MNKIFRNILYLSTGIITLSLVVPLSIWTASKSSKTVNEVEAVVSLSNEARREYLINETISTSGITFKYNNKEITPSVENIKYDFSSAGNKVVTINVSEDNVTYFASYYVDVFAVTTLDVSNYDNITIKSDGTVNAPDIKVVANLSGPANEFNKDPRFPGYDQTCFILGKNNYNISAVKSSDNGAYYNVTVQAGNAQYGFIYSNLVNGYVDCSSTDRIIEFKNSSLNDKSLTLYVTYSSTCFSGLGVNKNTDVEGTYVLRNVNGDVLNTYHFKYRVETWTSYFLSSTFSEGLTDSLGYGDDGAAFKVEVDSATYYAPGTSWHKAVLGG